MPENNQSPPKVKKRRPLSPVQVERRMPPQEKKTVIQTVARPAENERYVPEGAQRSAASAQHAAPPAQRQQPPRVPQQAVQRPPVQERSAARPAAPSAQRPAAPKAAAPANAQGSASARAAAGSTANKSTAGAAPAAASAPAAVNRRRKEKEPVAVSSRKKPVEKPKPAQTPPHKLRRREQRSGCLGGFMYFLFIVCLSVGLAFFAWMAASDAFALNKNHFDTTVTLPTAVFTTEEIPVTKEDGSTDVKTVSHADIEYVSDALYQAGLIHYRWLFEFYCSLSHADTKFDPGEYELKSSYDYRALVQNMRAGAGGITTVDVTIPEGFTIQEIFRRLEENKVAPYDSFVEAASGYAFNYDFLPDASYADMTRLEGFLYPDTYQFYVGMEASSAINKLLNNFYYKFDDNLISQAEKMGYSVKDILTIASIIEKEAKLEDDRAYVASVIYNRLRTGMTLGMDTTILYLYQDHEGEPTAEMLAEDSPYNTHIYPGLPPTPICNPGMPSISAALNPAESDYYYFYADYETGKLNFFTNYNEFAAYAQSHPFE